MAPLPGGDGESRRDDAFARVVALLALAADEFRAVQEQLDDRATTLVAQEKRRRRRRVYDRRLFDCAPIALIATDLMGTIADANRSATLMFGKERFELEGTPIVSFVPLEDRSTPPDPRSRVLLVLRAAGCSGVTTAAANGRSSRGSDP